MRERVWSWITCCSFFLLLPYLVICMINGTEAALLNRKFDIEKCIPLFLSSQISDDYDKETIRAQAVITRTNLYYELEEKDLLNILGELKRINKDYKLSFVDKIKKIYSYPQKAYEEAVLHTKNVVLKYDNEVKLAPFHLCSAGTTRDGEEVFRSKDYEYLVSVDSGFDKESEDYITITYFTEDELSGDIEIEELDQAGYVLSLLVNGKVLEGESFRKGMNLPSSNFSLQKINNRYQIICRGVGHGVGFSQYGGNALAERGKDWKEILNIYFPNMEIEEI